MDTLQLRWLGLPTVELKGRQVKLETRKGVALLAYLSTGGQRQQREVAATMLWPDGDQQRALASLRRTLSSLNSRLPGWMDADRETISLKESSKLWIDVSEFGTQLARVREHCSNGRELCDGCRMVLEEALELYRGDFLEGLILGDAPQFDDWQFLQREELRRELGTVLEHLTRAYAERSQWEPAIGAARRWIGLDRFHEPACRMLMDLYSRSDQRAAALRQYEDLKRLLQEQRDQVPEEETSRLYEKIRGPQATAAVGEIADSSAFTTILKTKLYIPSPPAQSVDRSRLVEMLAGVETHPLTLISAPAGFGKTTLLAEWIARTSLPVAWLSLDPADNDPERFLLYFAEALEGIKEGTASQVRGMMQRARVPDLRHTMEYLVGVLSGLVVPSILVIDDYHFITEHAIHEAMHGLAAQIPANLRLVISTRADPPIPLGRLRAHGQVLELRTRDLRFSRTETSAFLNDVMQLDLTPADINTLDGRTEGWVAGLQMAALSLRGNPDPTQFIREFGGSHRHVLDYLLDEVLKGQPPHIQAFLLETSILEKLSGPLCSAVCTGVSSQTAQSAEDILPYLEASNLFLEPLDECKEWYRYHHLFSDLLRSLLQKSAGAKAVAALHVRAAEWHEQNGNLLDAIHHASCAVDNERVERLIERHYTELLGRGEMASVRQWTSELSRESVYSRPQLCIYKAYSRSWFGELEETDALLDAAEKGILSGTAALRDQALRAHIAYVRGRVAAMRGQLPRASELILGARKALPDGFPALHSDMGITLGYVHFLSGNFAEASPILEETVRSGRILGAAFNVVAAHCLLARLNAIQGCLHAALAQYRQAADWLQSTGGQHLGISSLISVGRAEVLCEWNRLDAALTDVGHGLTSIHWWGKADDLGLAYITAARIHLARADLGAAQEAIEKAEHAILARGVFPEAPLAIELARVRLWLSQGDLRSAGQWAESIRSQNTAPVSPCYANELQLIARARVLTALGQYQESAQLLEGLARTAHSARRFGRLIEILSLRAIAQEAAGQQADALETLARAMKLGQAECYHRIFLDEGAAILGLLDALIASGLHPELDEYAAALLSGGRTPST